MVNEARLTEKYRQIAMLAATGKHQNKEIAQQVGCHYNTVTRALKMPEVQALIAEMRKAVEEQVVSSLADAFDRAAAEAFQKVRELMHGGPPSVALRAAESVLDRSREAPKREIHRKHSMEGQVVHLHVPKPQVELMHRLMVDVAEDPSEVPPMPQLAEGEELVAEIDGKTGEVLREFKAPVNYEHAKSRRAELPFDAESDEDFC